MFIRKFKLFKHFNSNSFRYFVSNNEITTIRSNFRSNVKSATNLFIVIGIFSLTGVCGYFIVNELFLSNLSPSKVYSASFDRIKDMEIIKDAFGSNIRAYGRDNSSRKAGRRNYVENQKWEDENGLSHVRIKYNIVGTDGTGDVYVERKNNDKDDFTYIIVKPDNSNNYITIVDNRPLPDDRKKRFIVTQLLNQNNGVLIGDKDCIHSQNQKDMFKDSIQFIQYLDCTDRPDICSKLKVRATPTWIINNKKYEGFLNLEDLYNILNS